MDDHCPAWVSRSKNRCLANPSAGVPANAWVCEKGPGHEGHHSAYVDGGHLCWGNEDF